MRRRWRLPSLVLAGALGLSGPGTALGQGLAPGTVRGRVVAATRTGMVDVGSAAAFDRRLAVPPARGGRGRDEATPNAPQPLPAAGPGFAGLVDNQGAIPPDVHGAVSPSWVMTVLNTQVQVQDRSGTVQAPTWPVTLRGFWNGVTTAPPLPAYGNVFAPRVHFDPDPAYGGRWIWVACQMPRDATSGLLVAVSADSAPTRGPGALFDADGADLVWAQYPSVGFNRHWVVVQVNMVSRTDPYPFVRSEVYVFRKSDLYAGNVATAIRFNLETACELGGNCGESQVPALTYDSTADDLYLVQQWDAGAGTLRLYRISGPVDTPGLTPLTPFVSGGAPWAEGEPSGTGADFAPQPPACGGHRIQTNDSRIQSVVFREGKIWATHTVFLPAANPDRAAVQWWQIRTDSTVEQRGLVDSGSPSRFYAFPSIAVNRNEDVLLGFSSFADDAFASAQYTFRLGSDPPDTMQLPVLLKAGEACYYKAPLGQNRWGDYSATVVDPFDDTALWTIQEYAETPTAQDRWGTWWGMVEPPRVSIADASITEGHAGTALLAFTLSLSVSVSDPVSVQWTTANDSATDVDDDYVPATGTVTFAPNATTATLQVAVRGDVKGEADERFLVSLGSPQYATIDDGEAAGTILNDDVPQVSVGDVTRVEGTGPMGTLTDFSFPVTLSNPSDATVTVSWSTTDGTAVAGVYGTGDYVGVAPTVLSFAPGTVARTVTVQVHADVLVEPFPDEEFYVDLTSPAGATILRSRGVAAIQDDDAPHPGVLGFNILADSVGSGLTDGRHRLQWVVPPGGAGATQTLIEFNEGPACTAPSVPGTGGGAIPVSPVVVGPNTQPHTGLVLGRWYCYTVWLDYGGGSYSAGVSLNARPYDSTNASNRVLWKLSTGTSLMPAPTVGLDAVLAVSNDRSVQALRRDPASPAAGLWPAGWRSATLGDLAHHRVPVVTRGSASRVFISTQDGRVHAIDTGNGDPVWSVLLPEGSARGAPAGIFTAFGGAWDYVLVGTSAASGNRFYALDPDTGAVIDAFPGPADGPVGIGAILGTAAVDYPARRVYFASRRSGGGGSLWCLELGPSSDALRLGWSRDLGADVDGSPVLRGGRVYVADNGRRAWSVPADTGSGGYSFTLGGTGLPKGFLFPDRRNGDLYLATDDAVHALTDNGTALASKWAPIFLNLPSVPLYRPGTDELYVGVRNYLGTARLLRIDTAAGTVAASVPLEVDAQTVGAPSLDIGYGVAHVGSEIGVLYAVPLPF